MHGYLNASIFKITLGTHGHVALFSEWPCAYRGPHPSLARSVSPFHVQHLSLRPPLHAHMSLRRHKRQHQQEDLSQDDSRPSAAGPAYATATVFTPATRHTVTESSVRMPLPALRPGSVTAPAHLVPDHATATSSSHAPPGLVPPAPAADYVSQRIGGIDVLTTRPAQEDVDDVNTSEAVRALCALPLSCRC
jgi:hypothetical protein